MSFKGLPAFLRATNNVCIIWDQNITFSLLSQNFQERGKNIHSPSDEEYFKIMSHVRISFLLQHSLYKNLLQENF